MADYVDRAAAAARVRGIAWAGNADVLSDFIFHEPYRSFPLDLDAHSIVDGKTALIYAIEKGHADCVDVLIRGGADVNRVDMDPYLEGAAESEERPSVHFRTPLMWAVLNRQTACVNILLCAGARCDLQDKIGHTVFEHVAPLVKEVGMQPIVHALALQISFPLVCRIITATWKKFHRAALEAVTRQKKTAAERKAQKAKAAAAADEAKGKKQKKEGGAGGAAAGKAEAGDKASAKDDVDMEATDASAAKPGANGTAAGGAGGAVVPVSGAGSAFKAVGAGASGGAAAAAAAAAAVAAAQSTVPDAASAAERAHDAARDTKWRLIVFCALPENAIREVLRLVR